MVFDLLRKLRIDNIFDLKDPKRLDLSFDIQDEDDLFTQIMLPGTGQHKLELDYYRDIWREIKQAFDNSETDIDITDLIKKFICKAIGLPSIRSGTWLELKKEFI